MAHFLDASALVKLYVTETGSTWVRSLVKAAPRHQVFVARVTGVEVVAAITRRRRGGSIPQTDAQAMVVAFRQAFSLDFEVAAMTAAVFDRAMLMAEKHGLRGYDAIQLAALLELNDERLALKLPPLVLVSADDELNAAAQAEGLAVEDPNAHP